MRPRGSAWVRREARGEARKAWPCPGAGCGAGEAPAALLPSKSGAPAFLKATDIHFWGEAGAKVKPSLLVASRFLAPLQPHSLRTILKRL